MCSRLIWTIIFAATFVALAAGEPAKPKQNQLELMAPLFLEGGDVCSFIILINIVSRPLSARAIAFTPDGRQIGKTTTNVDAHSTLTLKLADLLKRWASAASAGSLELVPDGGEVGMAAQVSMEGTVHGTAVHLEESFGAAAQGGAAKSRAAAAGVSGNPVVALWNRAGVAQTASVRCLSETDGGGTCRVSVPAGQMVLASACGGGVLGSSPETLISSSAESTTAQAAGIEVTGDGPGASLSIFGFAMRGSGTKVEPASLHFEDPTRMQSADAVFTGVPVGRSTLLPGPVFQPEIAVANFGSEAARVSVVYATAPAGSPSAHAIRDVTVPAGASRTVSLPALGGDPTHRNSFVLRSDAPAGTLFASLVSTHTGGNSGLMAMPGKDRARDTNGGAGRWSLSNGDSSRLVMLNPTESTHTMTVHMGALGVLWAKNYTLAPMETKSISVSDLIAKAEPDMRGVRIPSDATEGQIAWFTPNRGDGVGRLMVTNPNSTPAGSPELTYYSVLCGVSLDPYDVSFDFGDYGDLGPMIPDYCMSISPIACSGSAEGPGGGTYKWTSGNPSVAPVSGSSTSPSASFYGAYPGQASASCQVSTIYCVYECPPAEATVTLTAKLTGSVNPTSIALTSGSAALTSYVTIGPAPGGFTDLINVSIGSSDTPPSGMLVSYTRTGPGNPIPTSALSSTPPVVFNLSTEYNNSVSGSVTLALDASATDPKNANVTFNWQNTNALGFLVTVQ